MAVEHEEAERLIAAAMVQIRDENLVPATAQTIAEKSGLHEGNVLDILAQWGFKRALGGQYLLTREHWVRVEARALAAVKPPSSVSSNSFNFHNSSGIQAGVNVSGNTQHVTITTTNQQLLAELERQVDSSALAPEQKKEAKSLLRRFAEAAGPPLLNAAVQLIGKAVT